MVNKILPEDKNYDILIQTQPTNVPNNSMITFCKHFQYLVNYISYHFKDDYDVNHQIS